MKMDMRDLGRGFASDARRRLQRDLRKYAEAEPRYSACADRSLRAILFR
jgi:hypothetical protein